MVLLVILIIFFSVRGADNPVKGTVYFATSPLLKIFHGFAEGFRGFFSFLGSIGKLKEINENILKENAELKAQNALLADVQKENNTLRKEAGLLPKDKYSLEAADIIAEVSLGSSEAILIDRGKYQGIQDGMPVIISNGILVGKISRTFVNSAEVTLITDRASAINGEVEKSGAKGIVKGTYGLGIMMDMISQSEIVKEGDTVITSGLGGEMPRGLFVGKIGQASRSEDKLFQQASVVSPVDFESLRIVSVIKKF